MNFTFSPKKRLQPVRASKQVLTGLLIVASILSTTAPREMRAESLPGAKLADELSQAFEQVAETITPSVVTISTEP